MAVIKVKKDGVWEEIGTTSQFVGTDADTVDGKHASDFATSTNFNQLKELVGETSVHDQIQSQLNSLSGGKTLAEHLSEEDMILSPRQYGDKLPGEDGEPYTHVAGRIFFLRS